MSKNRILKRISAEQTWTVPGGVTQVRATVYRQLRFAQMTSAGNGSAASAAGISSGGDLWVWGNNNNGMLGVGDIATRSNPVLHPTRRKWLQISGGQNGFYLGIDEFGDAYAWGSNAKGQLGDGTVLAKSSPILIPGNKKWRQVSAGFEHSAGITVEGDLYTWGGNVSGELGDNTIVAKSAPVWVASGTKFQQVQLYNGFSCAIREDGVAMSWGYDFNGGLGAGSTTTRSVPAVVTGSPVYKRLFPSAGGVFAIDANDAAWAWGVNSSGMLGIGNTANQSTPIAVLGGKKWRSLGGIGQNPGALGVTTTGELYWWGDGFNNNANGAVASASSPTLASGTNKYRAVTPSAAGVSYATANDGRLWAWGRDDSASHTFGNGASSTASSPILVASGVQFKPLEMDLVADQVLNVTPGQALDVKLWSGAVRMGELFLSNPVDAPLVVLEYFA